MTVLSPELESTYEVLDTMGGGMGAVYKVRHRLFGEIRIIKVMQAALKDDSSLRERFAAEAKRGKQLKHRNIAEVQDFQIGSDGNAYLIMEFIDGVNLREAFFRTGQPLDPRTVVAIAEQALAALGYLHARNLIHRDISPENLMVTKDEDGCLMIKLIDLGIAKSLEDNTIALTRAGDFMGKLSYASPEQFGEKVDSRSDFYSLSIVLYELLTRFKPITAANTGAFVMAH
jgi:serine/threonine-protein kinase